LVLFWVPHAWIYLSGGGASK